MPYCRMVLAVAMVVGGLVYASERRISRKALRAVDPQSVVSDLSAAIAERGADELDRAVANRDDSISLAAAWQRVVRAGRGVQQAQERLSTIESARFLGVVEGRVGVRPPKLWDKSVAWGTRQPGRRVTFGIPLDEISSSLGSVRRVGEQDEVRFGKSAVTVDVDRRYLPPDRVSYVVDRGTAFVALYSSWPPLSYWLLAVDIESGRIVWKARVTALGQPRRAYSGSGWHIVDMRVTEDYVLLFGSSGECLYLEAFEKENGDPAIRFNSAYILADDVGERIVAPG